MFLGAIVAAVVLGYALGYAEGTHDAARYAIEQLKAEQAAK
jgi:hypothetical protein